MKMFLGGTAFRTWQGAAALQKGWRRELLGGSIKPRTSFLTGGIRSADERGLGRNSGDPGANPGQEGKPETGLSRGGVSMTTQPPCLWKSMELHISTIRL